MKKKCIFCDIIIEDNAQKCPNCGKANFRPVGNLHITQPIEEKKILDDVLSRIGTEVDRERYDRYIKEINYEKQQKGYISKNYTNLLEDRIKNFLGLTQKTSAATQRINSPKDPVEELYQYIKRIGNDKELSKYNITKDITKETIRHLLHKVHTTGEAEIEGLGTIVDEGRFNPFYDLLNPFSEPMNTIQCESMDSHHHYHGSYIRLYPKGKLAQLRSERTKKEIKQENSTENLRALYFPYMEVINESTLKYLILYFDKVYLISPYQAFDELWWKDKPFLELIKPYEFVNSDYLELIKENLTLDRENPVLQNWAEKYRFQFWEFHDTKANIFKTICPEMQGNKVPFLLGESFLTSLSLCACQKYNLSPITDNPLHFKFLSSRFERISKDPNVIESLKSQGIHKAKRSARAAFLVKEVLCETLPDFENLSPHSLLEFREKHIDSLHKFRVEMARLAALMELEIWEKDLENEVANIIDSQIKPALLQLKTELETLKLEFASQQLSSIPNLSSNIAQVGVPFILSLFSGLPITAALGIGIGSITLTRIIDYYAKRRNKKVKNTLAYLLDMSKLCQRKKT